MQYFKKLKMYKNLRQFNAAQLLAGSFEQVLKF